MAEKRGTETSMASSTPAPTGKKPYRTAQKRGEIRVAGERLLTVPEAAQSLGLCIDSVRRHLRSGKLEGVRVGGAWRVPESKLMAQLGLLGAMMAPAAALEPPEDGRKHRAAPLAQVVAAPKIADAPGEAQGEMDLVATLLRAPEVRTRVLALVEAAAVEAEIEAPQRALLAGAIERRIG